MCACVLSGIMPVKLILWIFPEHGFMSLTNSVGLLVIGLGVCQQRIRLHLQSLLT